MIYLQCDDNNTLDGDGCSSKCTIEPGWNCSYNTNKSVCQLIQPPSVVDWKLVKRFGRNRIKIVITLSRPIRIDGSRFTVAFGGVDSSYYSV